MSKQIRAENLTSVKKFLEFNGKSICFLAKAGTYYVALKPICEALNVQYVRQFKNAQKHPMWSQLLSKQTMAGADNKLYKMVSLPERYVYGWIFQIRSESPELIAYQKQCCDLLFEYFHGSITSRETLIKEKTKAELAKDRLINLLREDQYFQQLQQAQSHIRKITKGLRELDTEIQKDQLTLFQS